MGAGKGAVIHAAMNISPSLKNNYLLQCIAWPFRHPGNC